MIVYGIDPGTESSALVQYDHALRTVREHFTCTNNELMAYLYTESRHHTRGIPLVIEYFESFGMAVGAEVFRTVWWSGRMYEVWSGPKHTLTRKTVKQHICHSTRATDANIRAAIYDLFGGKLRAVGKAKTPGPLYGVKGHEMSALAVALTWAEQNAD